MRELDSWLLSALAILLVPRANASGKTPIYIDQIPQYTSLALCAQDRLSAIVRDQASGCSDNQVEQQLTSFACFCLDSRKQFASIISTAVLQQCSQSTAQAVASQTVTREASWAIPAAPRRGAALRQLTVTSRVVAQDVSSALEVWESYCAQATDLSLSQVTFPTQTTNTLPPVTIIVTQAPQTITVAPKNDNQPGAPVFTAILLPTCAVLTMPILALLCHIHNLRAKRKQMQASIGGGAAIGIEKDGTALTELAGVGTNIELQGSRFGHELEQPVRPVELDCGVIAARTGGDSGTMTWI